MMGVCTNKMQHLRNAMMVNKKEKLWRKAGNMWKDQNLHQIANYGQQWNWQWNLHWESYIPWFCGPYSSSVIHSSTCIYILFYTQLMSFYTQLMLFYIQLTCFTNNRQKSHNQFMWVSKYQKFSYICSTAGNWICFLNTLILQKFI